MTQSKFRSLVLVTTIIGVAGLAYAQQPPDAANTQSTAAPPAPASTPAPPATPAPAAAAAPTTAPTKPSAEDLKKARQNGYHAKVRKGVTYFCKEDAPLGTRFVTEKCLNGEQFWRTLDAEQRQRDELGQHVCTGGGSCGGNN